MKIIKDAISLDELKKMAAELFGDMVKAVVDVDMKLIALNAELHSDLEALLLENGSRQKNLWGINLYPELSKDDFIEFDSMINMRPSHGNKSRSIDNLVIRGQIIDIIEQKVKK